MNGTKKEVYDLSPTLCLVMDPEGVVIDCNLAFVKALGYLVKSEILGRSFPDYADLASRPALVEIFRSWQLTGKVHNYELRIRRADGSSFPALLNATSIHDEFGRTIACNASILNITELANARKKLEDTMQELVSKEKELHKANEDLLRVEKAKEEFLSLVSHELKNPLTPIIGFSELLCNQAARSRQLTDLQLDTIKIINDSGKELRRLIDDMLCVYKLDMKLAFAFHENRITEIVDRVIHELTSMLQEKEIAVEKLYALDNEDAAAACDGMRIRQVLVNLVRNSVDFVPDSRGKIQITVEKIASAEGQRMIQVSVTDNGPGVPEDKQAGLFRKFYQAYANVTRRHGGTGLGLTICKEIVEMHGGNIWYDTGYKNGARFRFTIPKVHAAAAKGVAA